MYLHEKVVFGKRIGAILSFIADETELRWSFKAKLMYRSVSMIHGPKFLSAFAMTKLSFFRNSLSRFSWGEDKLGVQRRCRNSLSVW